MKNYFFLLIAIVLISFTSCDKKRKNVPKLLVFSKTMGFEHASIPQGIASLEKLGRENGFSIDTTKNAALFNDENLAKYSAIVFLSTTGNVLNHKQEAAFERYIQAGGSFVGIHAATDTEYDWGWYTKLVGGQFLSHPSGTPKANFIIRDVNHPATEFFTDSVWHRVDELYNFKKLNADVNVLMAIDESSYEGGENGNNHPMSWYHSYDGGRAFYTAGGHTAESYSEDLFLKHLLGGITYAIGENLELDYSKATTQIPPNADRFSKVQLVGGEFFEPTEMTILPNNDVLVSERGGTLYHYSEETKEMKKIASLDVYNKTLNTPGVNAEEGFMGLQKDPNYNENHWIYTYYAPTGDKWVNRLSRFKFENGVFDMNSEQVILDVDSQREICCHTGGSIAFGGDGLLYLSTGDNSTPFDEPNVEFVNNGYAPLNDLPGKEQYDARRSSGNTNDLRGKILRIKVNEDGSYDIPEGNLFPVGTAKTRPEIYTMGHRNPYRISVDPKNGYVYWGDVGPDARQDNIEKRGPMGYDEMGQARGPGNFGWPLFIADSKSYVDYDYATGESGLAFDPKKPINDSKNNTGLRELPPAQPAYIYYPYGVSRNFPEVDAGSRNAMAGPVFYSDQFENGGGLPGYYNGKVLIYEWMRGWMKAVTLFEDGSFNKMEPFASEIDLNNLIDMELSDDGRIYLLEYGSTWFSKNDDSALSYIEFNGGNRPPVIENVNVKNTSGSLPLSFSATVKAHDRENDSIVYVWNFGNGITKETTENTVNYTYNEVGDYKVFVELKDTKGAIVKSNVMSITAGNARPEVTIDLKGGNSSFFKPGTPVTYQVSVTDPDVDTAIDPNNIFVSVDYLEGLDQVNMSLGHQQVSAEVTGKALTQSMDCKSCHKEIDKSIGPNYLEISNKYKDQKNILNYLQTKIIEGGSGVWGEVVMPAHPTVTTNEARQIALYIQSLAKDKINTSLPPSGAITPKFDDDVEIMVLTASYTDKGVGSVKSLTGVSRKTLRSNTVYFTKNIEKNGFLGANFGGRYLLTIPKEEGWFKLNDIDLTGLTNISLTARWRGLLEGGIQFELRSDSPDGKLLGTGTMAKSTTGQVLSTINISLNTAINQKFDSLYFVHKPIEGEDRGTTQIALINAIFN